MASIKLTTGTFTSARITSAATAFMVLQAMTMAFTRRTRNQWAASFAMARISLGERSP